MMDKIESADVKGLEFATSLTRTTARLLPFPLFPIIWQSDTIVKSTDVFSALSFLISASRLAFSVFFSMSDLCVPRW